MWDRWRGHSQVPRDWLIADGTTVQSVAAVFDALQQGSPMPAPSTIVGDWEGSPDDRPRREEYRSRWDETVRRNQAMWRKGSP
jgi:hypothetical protein